MKVLLLCLSLALFSCDNGEKEGLENELQNCESEKEQLKKQVSELEDKVSELEQELDECISTAKRYKSDLDDLEFQQQLNELNQ